MNRAVKAYQNIIDLLYPIYEESYQKYTTVKPNHAFEKFDVALQYSLIQIVLIDLRFSIKERDFIKNISKYGDIIRFLIHEGKKEYSWDNIANPDVTNLIKDLDELRGNLGDYIAPFVSLLIVLLPLREDGQQIYDLFCHYLEEIFIDFLNYDEDTNTFLYQEIKDTPIYFVLEFINKKSSLELHWKL